MHRLAPLVLIGLFAIRSGLGSAQEIAQGPQDLALTFTSPFDGSAQPYRLYLPSAYDGKKALPLLVTLHGTGGDQNKYFDHENYHHGVYKTEAEKRGLILLSPLGTDAEGLPTEWRGEAELNVLAVLDEVQKRFRIDASRIVCTGQSMGGTGTTYLCCRYPDLFAAGIPLASTYSHLSLIINLRDVPMLFVQGEQDWPIYAATGPLPITQELKRLGYKGELWMIPNAGHNTFDISTPRVLDWALQQKRVAHPRHVTHRAYFPAHGRAWWIEIQQIERQGWFAEVEAQMIEGNQIHLDLKNTNQVLLRPDPTLYDPTQPLIVRVQDQVVFRASCTADQQLRLTLNHGNWQAKAEPRKMVPRTDWKDQVIGSVTDPLNWDGGPETTLGNWITDAMRDITGADIAFCTKGHHRVGEKARGRRLRAGQTLHLVDLINWLRPSDAALARFKITGADLLKIIEMNLLDGPKADMFLVQVSGCRYRFDRSRPQGNRVIETDIQPDRTYQVVCNSFAITRTDTLHLGDFFGKLDHETLEPNLLSTAWRFLSLHNGQLSGKLENRVSETKP